MHAQQQCQDRRRGGRRAAFGLAKAPLLAASLLLAGCAALPAGTKVERSYPVSGSEARQSGSNYRTVSAARGSVIDAVPGGAGQAGLPADPATERAGRRIGWRVFGADEAVEEPAAAAADPYRIASLGNPRLVVPPSMRSSEAALPPPGAGEDRRLWRGALDVLSFMPIVSADPAKGAIVTDWYLPPERPDERFRVTVFVLAQVPAAENLRVMLQRQVREDEEAQWRDAVVTPDLLTALEQQILTQAAAGRAAP